MAGEQDDGSVEIGDGKNSKRGKRSAQVDDHQEQYVFNRNTFFHVAATKQGAWIKFVLYTGEHGWNPSYCPANVAENYATRNFNYEQNLVGKQVTSERELAIGKNKLHACTIFENNNHLLPGHEFKDYYFLANNEEVSFQLFLPRTKIGTHSGGSNTRVNLDLNLFNVAAENKRSPEVEADESTGRNTKKRKKNKKQKNSTTTSSDRELTSFIEKEITSNALLQPFVSGEFYRGQIVEVGAASSSGTGLGVEVAGEDMSSGKKVRAAQSTSDVVDKRHFFRQRIGNREYQHAVQLEEEGAATKNRNVILNEDVVVYDDCQDLSIEVGHLPVFKFQVGIMHPSLIEELAARTRPAGSSSGGSSSTGTAGSVRRGKGGEL